MEKFLLPNHFLSRNERKTAKGKIYWLAKDKKVFCKTYLDVDYKSLDKHQLHNFMYKNRGGFLFDGKGFPIWQYTEKPIKLVFKNEF